MEVTITNENFASLKDGNLPFVVGSLAVKRALTV